MNAIHRRRFLSNVGSGMLIGAIGTAGVSELGLASEFFNLNDDNRLEFGPLEALADLMQMTPPEELLPQLTPRLGKDLDLKTMTAAAALANARRFGGQDYTGYHTFMALAPAFAMSKQLSPEFAPLPVLKVIYRNAERIQETGGGKDEHLHEVDADVAVSSLGEPLQAAIRQQDIELAERTLASLTSRSIGEAYNHLQFAIQDEIDVHRVVLPWRAWASLDIVGQQHALTLLRQSVRFCVDAERNRIQHGQPTCGLRELLPKLLDEHKLLAQQSGTRRLDDAEVQKLSETIYGPSREEAAKAVAAILADGVDPESVGEAMSLAACMLVLHDPGRTRAEPGKPIGSVHGASVGVHASDSANAWRQIARVTDHRNRVASLIAGAYHTAGQSSHLNEHPWPLDEHLRPIETRDPAEILKQLQGAVRENNQARATALVYRYGELDQPSQPVFDTLLQFAASEDGQLHAEKYYWSVVEEFGTLRESIRWRQLCSLARVTASEYGTPAKGYDLGRKLLGV